MNNSLKLLKAIRSALVSSQRSEDHAVLQRLDSLLESLTNAPDSEPTGAVVEFLSDNPSALNIGELELLELTLHYLEGEVGRLEDLKGSRGLTAEERTYARDALLPLHEAVSALFLELL